MSFKTQISQKIVSIVFSVLVVCFGIGFYVFAWTEPPAPPPGGNVAVPLNVGPIGQTKLGGLILNTSAVPAENGLIVAQGNVGIGTVSPQAIQDGRTINLDVVENIVAKDVYLDDPKTGNPRWASEIEKDCQIELDGVSYPKEIICEVEVDASTNDAATFIFQLGSVRDVGFGNYPNSIVYGSDSQSGTGTDNILLFYRKDTGEWFDCIQCGGANTDDFNVCRVNLWTIPTGCDY